MSLAEMRPAPRVEIDMPLVVRSITKKFRRRPERAERRAWRARKAFHTAVDDVSFRITPGEIYGVIGANGSGKSTLIRMLRPCSCPMRGEVCVFGHDALRDPLSVRPCSTGCRRTRRSSAPCRRSRICCSSAGPTGSPGGNWYETQPPDPGRLARRGAGPGREPMLRHVAGQQQKVAVARAFLTRPRLMLLDEPTTGLDPRSKRDVQALRGRGAPRGLG